MILLTSTIIYTVIAACLFIILLSIDYYHEKRYGKPIGSSDREDFLIALGWSAAWPLSCVVFTEYVCRKHVRS